MQKQICYAKQKRILNQCLIAMSFIAVIIVLLQQYTPIDIWLENLYFEQETQTFPWRDTWFADTFMHQQVKQVFIFVALFWLVITLVDTLLPSCWHAKPITQLRLRFVAAAIVCIPSTIALLKSHSPIYCPWDLQMYGGTYPYISLFDAFSSYTSYDGHCQPAGHATTGLWLASLGIFWVPNNLRRACMVTILGLLAGFMMGWVQQMRGAHFLSHTLWSVWLSMVIVLLMWSSVQKKMIEQYFKED